MKSGPRGHGTREARPWRLPATITRVEYQLDVDGEAAVGQARLTVEALANANIGRLVAIPGVGKRTAERLVVELQDRVRKLMIAPATDAAAADASDAEAVSALVNLGYRAPDAERAVRAAIGVGQNPSHGSTHLLFELRK